MRGFRQSRPLIFLCLISMLLLMALAPVGAAKETPPTFTLTIIHTNDFHGYAPYALAQKYTIIKKIRAKAKNVLLLDAGDLFARGPHHKDFYGQMEIAAYNAMGYDAWELGNNEFKGFSDETKADEGLAALTKQATFATLCSNVTLSTGENLPGVRPYFVKDFGGIKVGVVGICIEKVKGYKQSATKIVTDPYKTAKKYLLQLREETQIQVLLSHAGLPVDLEIADDMGKIGLSAIISADDHIATPQPIYYANMVPIAQTGGEELVNLGRLDLTYELKEDRWVLVSHKGMLYPITAKVKMDKGIKAIIDSFLAKVQKPAA